LSVLDPLQHVQQQGWQTGAVPIGTDDCLQLCLVMPDGSLLVSDDKGERIYRIVYTG